MGLLRTSFALLIAASLAMLPVPGGAVAVSPSMGMTVAVDGSPDATAMAAMDCCPDETAPCDKTPDQCPSMASCLQAISLFAVDLAKFEVFVSRADRVPALADNARHLPGAGPPLPPPRV
jgi:hypothetical protein